MPIRLIAPHGGGGGGDFKQSFSAVTPSISIHPQPPCVEVKLRIVWAEVARKVAECAVQFSAHEPVLRCVIEKFRVT